MIDLKRIRYFVAVASERSFTRAASKLNMAQPPLSRRIQELEEDIGTPLIDREARPLELTPAGRLFYEQSVQVLQRLDQMDKTVRQFVGAERARFTIGLVPSGFHARLPEVIRRYRTLAPNVDLTLREMTSLEQVAALKDGRIDAALGRVRVEDAGIRREILREEPLLVAIPPGHPLCRGDAPLDFADLAAVPLVLYPSDPRPSFADHILSLFHDAAVEPEHVIEVRELHTALVMVSAECGACIVPASARMLAHPDVVFRQLTPQATSPVILSHRLGDSSPALIALFRTFADLMSKWGHPIPPALQQYVVSSGDAGDPS